MAHALVSPLWITHTHRTQVRVALILKRDFDIALSALFLIVLLPVMLLLAVAVRLSSRGPALFVQRRIGYLADEFEMCKFRTMVDHAEEMEERLARTHGGTFFKLQHDPRVTRLGRIMRKYSLDELPQLVHVLRGEMSLVGPRPILRSDFDNFPKREQMRRFAMKPGLTGLWQISGRSACSDEERLALDLAYVDNWNLWLDLRILAATPATVLRAEGAW